MSDAEEMVGRSGLPRSLQGSVSGPRASGWRGGARRARPGCWIVPRRPGEWLTRTSPQTERVIAVAQTAALHRAGAQRAARVAVLDGLGGAASAWGWASWGASGWRRRFAMSASDRASCCTSTSRSSGASTAARASASPAANATRVPARPTPLGCHGCRSAGTRCTSRSTTPPDWPTPNLPDEKASTATAFLLPRSRVLRHLRHHRRTGPHRQRIALPLSTGTPSLAHNSAVRHPAHPPLPTTNQRQSRTLHPHPPSRLGLRRHLRLQHTTHPSP